jgi:hypothetical protein
MMSQADTLKCYTEASIVSCFELNCLKTNAKLQTQPSQLDNCGALQHALLCWHMMWTNYSATKNASNQLQQVDTQSPG